MFKRHVILTFGALMTVLFTNAMALQVKSARDSQTLLFKISAKEYSRIAVGDDRIVSVKGRSSAFETRQFGSEGGDDGVVYIKPSTGDGRPFSLFIATESGRHYTLMLTVSDVPAENIKIVPVSAVTYKARHWERSSPYTDTIISLVRAMYKGTLPDGYARINMGRMKEQRIQPEFTAQLQTVFRGNHLQGEVWNLRNDSRKTLSVYPENFIRETVRAISVSNDEIPPHGITRIYRIVEHE